METSSSPISPRSGSLANEDSNNGELYTNENESRHHDNEEEEEKPAWSELKTKAGKERKRLPLACIACRRKKIRCSGEKPACKHCLKARIPCVYKITARKPTPRTDYMTMLDKRLKRMEERVIKLAPEHDASKLAAIGRSSVKPYVAPTAKINANKKRFAEEAFGNELTEWASADNKSQGAATLPNTIAKDQKLMQEGREYLPSPDIQEHLSEVFFEYIYGQAYHVLHKPSYMRKLKAGKVPPVLILTVCAISARFSTHPQIDSEPVFLRGEEWAEPARRIALQHYDEPSITTVIVYLLLGLHEFGTCHGGRSWMFGGMALRMAFALQLHRELDPNLLAQQSEHGSDVSFTDREIRRRTMWACFLMDRFNSSGTDRPMFSSEDDIKIQLPVKEFNFQMEIPGITEDVDGNLALRTDITQDLDVKENMDVAAYLIRIVSLWGKVVEYVNLGGKQRDPYSIWNKESEFTKLKRRLKEFLEELPERLRYTPDTLRNHAAENLANQFIFVHIACSQIVLFLHKFAIPAGPGAKMPSDIPKEFVAQSAKTAIEAASRISMLVKDAAEYRVSAPFAGYCAFAASTVHVWGIFSSNQALETVSKQNLTYGIRYLTQMKQYWGMFHHMVESLKSIYRQHAEWSTKGLHERTDSNVSESLFQYGDWFRKYPHGVSGADPEDPASPVPGNDTIDLPLYEKPELQTPEEFFKEAAKNVVPIPRKVARKQAAVASKAAGRNSTVKAKQEDSRLGIPDDNQAMRNLSLSPTTAQPQILDTADFAGFDPSSYMTAPDLNAYNLNTQPLAMSELDRHLVFGAYAQDFNAGPIQAGLPDQTFAMQASTDSTAQQIPQSTAMNSILWDNGTQDYGMPNQGFQDLTGSVWSLPFNLLPPDLGDINGNEFMNEYNTGTMDVGADV